MKNSDAANKASWKSNCCMKSSHPCAT